LVEISRLEIYDLLYKQAIIMGHENDFLARFGSREEYKKKHDLQESAAP
jgi:hypothetical protein